jgi:mono/diheme cytochrome c family protein
MWQICFILGFLTVILSACEQKERPAQSAQVEAHIHGTPKDWKFTWPAGNAAEGRKLFVEAECHKCHEIKGETFPAVVKDKGDVGPELAQMAGSHPAEFFAESIINPNGVIDDDAKENGYVGADGKSKMPEYNDTFTVRQVADLAAYLTSLTSLKAGGHKH